MSRRKKQQPAAVRRWGWRRILLATLGVALVGGAGWWVRTALVSQAAAHPTQGDPRDPAGAPVMIPDAPPSSSDYHRRVVAYIYESEPVTRAELGEYLIARHGPEKIGVLVNKGIIESAARQHGLEVTAAEVESALAESMTGLNMDRANFLKTFLSRYHMNVTEWKEEVLRPRLLLTKLCRSSVSVSDDEVRRAFEAAYGEKVECRIILYPNSEQGWQKALAEYGEVRTGPDAFEAKARTQFTPAFAGCAGKIKPFGRYEMEDPELDRIAFRLRPNEISEVVRTRQGPAVLLCLARYPADTTANLEGVRGRLVKDLLEKKQSEEMKTLVPRLREQADPRVYLKRPNSASPPVMPEDAGEPRPNQVVATYNGNVPITREELGEYLITCFGTEKLELLVNRRIIDKECAARGITVSDREMDASLDEDLKKLNVDRANFVKEFLGTYKKTLYEYCEDAVRPRLLLGKLSADRVRVTDEDLRRAFEAYYGEKLECRMILWPLDQTKYALTEYPKIRDSEKAFADKAKQQASPTLAAHGGKMPPFGHFTLDDPAVEAEAFKLQPGEVSTLIGTAQGNAVVKCDRRIPPDSGVTLEQVRPRLEKEVRERKAQQEMQVAFNELASRARPQLMLKDGARPVNLRAEMNKALSDLPEAEKARLGLRGLESLAPPVP